VLNITTFLCRIL